MGVMVQSAVNAWLKDKSYQIVDITHAIQKRVDNWRYVTWQIYDNIAATTSPSSGEGLQETRLKQDVYYLGETTPQNGSVNLWLSRQLNA